MKGLVKMVLEVLECRETTLVRGKYYMQALTKGVDYPQESGELIRICILHKADQYDAWLNKSAVAKPHNKFTMEELKEELVLEG